MRFPALVLSTLLTLTAVTPAFAQKPPPAERGQLREQMRARVAQKIQTWLTVELTTRVGLDQKKSGQLSEALKSHIERKQERNQRLREEMQKLRGLVDGKASDPQLKAQLDVVLGAASKDDDMHQFVRDAAKFLTPTEQARLALAMPELLKDMRKMMRDVRREMHGKRAGGGFGGGAGPAGRDDDDEL